MPLMPLVDRIEMTDMLMISSGRVRPV